MLVEKDQQPGIFSGKFVRGLPGKTFREGPITKGLLATDKLPAGCPGIIHSEFGSSVSSVSAATGAIRLRRRCRPMPKKT